MAYLGAQPNKTLTKTTSQSFNGTGSATTFTLNRAVNTGEELEVFVENVQQEPGSGKSYTASGTTLTFDEAPPSGTGNVYVIYRGQAEVTTRLEHDANQALSATTGTFTGDLTVDTNTLKVDSSNNRLGVGTASPSTKIHLNESGSANAVQRVQAGTNGYAAQVHLYGNNVSGASYNAVKSFVNGDSTPQWEITGPEASAEDVMTLHTGGSERMRINSSAVGIGETSPLGTVHIRSSDASLTSVNGNADDLILENNGNCGMTICSSTTGEGNINFVDSGDTNIGRIQYHHNTNEMQFRTNDGVRMEITSNGNLMVDSEANTATLAKHQVLTGTATAAGSNSYKKVIRCGHTFSGRVSVIALQSFGVGSASANFTASVSYGSPSVTKHNVAGGGNITNINMQYNNGGSPNYTFDIAVTYTGSAPTLYVTVSGNSHTEMYIV